MTKYLLFLLFNTLFVYSQDHHFKANNKTVSWQLTYKTTETDILSLIDKNHIKITVNKENNTGIGFNLNCDCKGGGWYFEQSFDIKFNVEIISDTYLITVYNIIFDGENENETNYEKGLERFVLKMGKNEFHDTDKNKINLMCLDTYFTKLFKIQNSEVLN